MAKKRILVVDDSKPVREHVRELLTAEGFEIFEAEDGHEGLRVIGESAIDLVFCDIHMPRIDGVEMLARLRADPARVNLPIVMLTAEGSPAQIERAKRLGAKGWIVKPVVAQHLIAIARKLGGAVVRPAIES